MKRLNSKTKKQRINLKFALYLKRSQGRNKDIGTMSIHADFAGFFLSVYLHNYLPTYLLSNYVSTIHH